MDLTGDVLLARLQVAVALCALQKHVVRLSMILDHIIWPQSVMDAEADRLNAWTGVDDSEKPWETGSQHSSDPDNWFHSPYTWVSDVEDSIL